MPGSDTLQLRFVYRSLRVDEEPDAGLKARASAGAGSMSIAEAIASGSSIDSPYIHTTRNARVAVEKYASGRIAIINLDLLPTDVKVFDGKTEALQELGADSQAYRFACSDDEVVLVGTVPSSAVVGMASEDVCKVGPKRLQSCGSLQKNLNNARRRLGALEEDALKFKVAGVSKYSDVVSKLSVHQEVILEAEDDNPHDSNAVCIHTTSGETLGYVPRDCTRQARQLLVNGRRSAKVAALREWHGPTGVEIIV